MDHSLFVIGGKIENMAGGREILNILLRKSREGGAAQAKFIIFRTTYVNFTFVVEKGWGEVLLLKCSCHKYYQTIVFLVIILLIVMIMLREIMQAIMCFCHYCHHFDAGKGVRVLPHLQLCGLLCCLKIVK